MLENPGALKEYSESMTSTLIEDAIKNTDFSAHNRVGDNILHMLAIDKTDLSEQIIAELKESHTDTYVRLLNEENSFGKIPLDYMKDDKQYIEETEMRKEPELVQEAYCDEEKDYETMEYDL